MALFTKESLERLRQRVDLVDVLSGYLEMKRSGASYKSLCPFHDEHTPSFMIQKGDTHYHCFGCGAHGDAIQFLMSYQRMTFSESVESLAQRFNVTLEKIEDHQEQKGPSKARLKEVLESASRFYQFYLLNTPEGHRALEYLRSRRLDMEFIRTFQLGFSPSQSGILQAVLYKQGFDKELLRETGLLGQSGREFFHERIMIPIRDAVGAVIGFSARKLKESTFGGKYVNTPETPLFKKSRILFGLNYCRRRIAKERKAIIVEGQLDALRLIQTGFNFTVAGQGTAFGEGHMHELLQLGVNEVYLALDGDSAGREASVKIGNLFQKEGVEVYIVPLPEGVDPDALLNKQGSEGFLKLLEQRIDYLTFLVQHLSKKIDMQSPAAKNELVETLSARIREWHQPVMVHESLRKLANLVQVPVEMISAGTAASQMYVRKVARVGNISIDPHRILEADCLRWLLLMGEERSELPQLAMLNLSADDFSISTYRLIYERYISAYQEGRPRDLLSLAIDLGEEEGQQVLSEVLEKKINRDRALDHFQQTLLKLLERRWMEKREEIKRKIQSGQYSDDDVLELAKEFDQLKRSQPVLQCLT